MSDAPTAAPRIDPSFVRARVGSLLAVVPLGAWTALHLWNNLAAFQGAAAWQEQVTGYAHPLAFFVSALVALLPLVLHTIWGLGRLATAAPNDATSERFGNAKLALQRLSALGVMLFLGAHVWLAMLHPRLTTGRPKPFADLSHEMHHHLPTLVVYLLGTLGVAYHLANGLHTFTTGWGIVTSGAALRRLGWGALLAFVALLGLGWGAIYALWDAGT